MKLLFVPWYYYIQFDMFYEIIKKAADKNKHRCFFIYSKKLNAADKSIDNFDIKRLRRDSSAQIIKLPLLFFKNSSDSNLKICHRFFQILNSIILVFRIIILKPDCLIIGSSLGGLYIRLIQSLCLKLRIPVASLWLTKDKPDIKKYNRFVEKIFVKIGLDYVLNWNCNAAENRNSVYMVSGESLKKHLLQLGISAENIEITGNPVFEKILMKNKFVSSEKNKMECSVKKIIFFTEAIQEIYGMEYLKHSIKLIKKSMDDCNRNAVFIIRFHPREPENIRKIYKSVLTGEKYFFSDNEILLENLIDSGFLSIGHFSAVLGMSIIHGKPAISIDFTGNKKSFYDELNDDFLFAENSGTFTEKLNKLLSDPVYYEKACGICRKWVEINYTEFDCGSSEKCLNTIESFVIKKKNECSNY